MQLSLTASDLNLTLTFQINYSLKATLCAKLHNYLNACKLKLFRQARGYRLFDNARKMKG